MDNYESDIRAIRTNRQDVQEIKEILIKLLEQVELNSDDISKLENNIEALKNEVSDVQ